MIFSDEQKKPYSPITEAVIEVIVDHQMTTNEMAKIAKKLSSTYYPIKQDINISTTHHHPAVGGGISLAVNSTSKEYHLNTNDQTDIAIIKENSLITARLAPYLGWNDLHEKFINAWKIWKITSKTKPIKRIGVRYINRIDIDLMSESKIELEDYLNFYPKLPELSASPVAEYLIQVSLPIDNLWSANIASTLLPSPLINNISILMDIDVFRTADIPIKDEDLWATITEARSIKNLIFENCITQKTKELFS